MPDTIAQVLAQRLPSTAPSAGWSMSRALAATRYGAAVSTDGTNIFVTHGYTTAYTASGEAFSGGSGTGTTVMPTATSARVYVAGIWCNGRHWVVGGINSSNFPVVAVEAYTPAGTNGASGAWATATNGLPSARGFLAGTAVGNYLYVAGGLSASGAANATTTVYRYNTANGLTGSWEMFANGLPAARYGGSLVAVGTKLFYLGGFDASGNGSSVVYVYDTANGTAGTWSVFSSSGTGIASNGPAVVIGSTIWQANNTAIRGLDASTGAVSAPPNVAAHGAYGGLAAIGNTLFYVSGQSTANVDALDTAGAALATVAGWSTLAALPAARQAAAVSTDGTLVYLSGGLDAAGTNIGSAGYTITAGGVVTQATAPATPRYGAAGAFYNGKHYSLGGRYSTASQTAPEAAVNIYTPAGTNGAGGSWATGPAMPGQVAYASAAVLGGFLYVAGGQTGSNVNTTNSYFFRFDGTTWTNLFASGAGLPAPRTQGSLVAVGTKLYYVGGYDATNTTSASVFCYDTVAGTWSTLTSAPLAIGAFPAVAVGSSVVVLGNAAGSAQPLLVFNTSTGTWSQVQVSPPTAHSLGGGAAAIGSTVYFVSGSGTANVDAVDPTVAGSTPFSRRLKALQQYAAATDPALYAAARRVPSSLAAPAWATLAALPATRYAAAVSTDGTNIYVTHGYIAGVQNSGLTITPAGIVTGISTVSSGNARQLAGAVFCNGRHYVIGGQTASNTPTNLVDAYTPAGAYGAAGTWSVVAVLPSSRLNVAAAAVGNVIYAAGGQVNTATSGAGVFFARYDTTTNTWTDLTATAPLPAARTQGALVAVGTKLYYLGGFTTAGAVSRNVYVYDTTVGTWTTAASMGFDSANTYAVASGGVIYLMTGNNTVSGYVIADGSTVTMTPTTPSSHGAQAGLVLIGNLVYLIGGASTANIDRLDLATAQAVSEYTPRVRRTKQLASV